MAQTFLTESGNDENHSNESPKLPIRERSKIFVHRDIDELGLDPYEFRIYGHIARRGSCFASLDKIAATCCMSVRKVQYVLKVLHKAGLIHKEERKGRVNTFRLAKPSRWLRKVDKEKLNQIRKTIKAKGSQRAESVLPDTQNLENRSDEGGETSNSVDDIDFLSHVPF